MDTKLIAKILPTKTDGKRTIGTGYPIAKDLVLTARHVVIFPERDDSKPIVIEWTDCDCTEEVTEIVFDGGAECDIAILRCKIPEQAHVAILARRFPIVDERWAGFGYPQIGKNENAGTRDKIPVKGDFYSPDATSHKILLTSDGDALEKEGWRGVSGVPAFQGNTLYAVITSTPTNRGECFTAVSIPHLFEHNKAFCEALKSPIDEEAIKAQTKALHNTIKLNIKKLLLKNFNEELLKEYFELPDKNNIDGMVEYLLENKASSVRESIAHLTRVLQKHDKIDNKATKKCRYFCSRFKPYPHII